jgi:hypothetical protein
VLCALIGIACTPQELEVVDCREACGGSAGGSISGGSGGTSGESSGGAAGENPGGSAGQGAASGTGGSGGTAAAGFPSTLVHRYDFEGTGTTVLDRVGIDHGTLVGAMLGKSGGRGAAILAGRNSRQYVELPRGIVSRLPNATFEVWVTWSGQGVWERIFDFGDAKPNDAGVWHGSSYLFLTPRAPTVTGVMRMAQQRGAPPELIMNGDRALPVNVRAHVVLVVDNDSHVLGLYLDGEQIAVRGIVDRDNLSFDALATVNDENVWLGSSLYEQDAYFGGIFHEFRIYNAALTAAEIKASYERGPDPEIGD